MILLVFRRIVDCGGGGGLRKGGNKQYALKFLELHVDYIVPWCPCILYKNNTL